MMNHYIYVCQKPIITLLKSKLLKKTLDEGSSKAEKEVKGKSKENSKGKGK